MQRASPKAWLIEVETDSLERLGDLFRDTQPALGPKFPGPETSALSQYVILKYQRLSAAESARGKSLPSLN